MQPVAVDGAFDDDFIGGARLTYFFTPVLGIEGGIGFTPASIIAAGNVSGGSNLATVIKVDTYIFNANLVAQLGHGPIMPFVTGGVAAVHFDFGTDRYGYDPGYNYYYNTPSETDFAWNVGGGVKIPIHNEFMLRAEARYYGANSEFADDTIYFTEVSGGLAVRFNF